MQAAEDAGEGFRGEVEAGGDDAFGGGELVAGWALVFRGVVQGAEEVADDPLRGVLQAVGFQFLDQAVHAAAETGHQVEGEIGVAAH